MSAVGRLLFADPPTKDGFPDSSLKVGVAFEVGGAHESWGFTVDRVVYEAERRCHRLERVAEGRTLDEACERARETLKP